MINVFDVVYKRLVAELRAAWGWIMPQYNDAMYQKIQSLLPQLPGGTISQDRLTETMQKAKVVVRTGDFGSCCTMVLYSASGMDKYVKQYDCSFSLEK